jgi:hypothetical protein
MDPEERARCSEFEKSAVAPVKLKDLKKAAFSRTYGNNSPLKKAFKEDSDDLKLTKHISSTSNIPSPPPGGMSSTI